MKRTGVVWEPIFAEHIISAEHPESPKRILGIKQVLEMTDAGRRSIRLNSRVATMDELAWVHDQDYIEHIKDTKGKTVHLDPDTTASPKTWDSAISAVGGAITCVDAVLSKKVDNAFALIRPPGHHAERSRAMGFCFFNNIAIAAEYAIKKFGLHRITIVDFDVHHGNGTQHAFYRRSDVYYISSHNWPFYPGTGSKIERGEDLGKGYTLNMPLNGGDDDFRRAYDVIIPKIEEYRPELILVSAGYDAHEMDPLGGFSVTTRTYNWVTKKLVEVAEKCCDGKIVLVLEGGYNIDALKVCVEDALNILEGFER